MQSKAVVQRGNDLLEESVTLPSLESNQILVRVHYAALNPTDVLAFGLQAFGDGAILGCDFSGTVEEVGSAVTRFSKGDEIATFMWGGEIQGIGAFSEFCIADEAITFKVPKNISLEQASTIPLAAMTAWLALYSEDCLHLSLEQSKDTIIVLGGSSSVGTFTNQIAASRGVKTLATCSKRNAENVRKDGVETTYDYNDPEAMSSLESNSQGIKYVFDTVGNPGSTASAGRILQKEGGRLCTVRPGKAFCEELPSNVSVGDVFVFTVFLKEHNYRGKAHWPPHPKNHELGKHFTQLLPELISEGKLRPRPVKSMGKLTPQSLLEGIKLIKDGKVSNEKICFTVGHGL